MKESQIILTIVFLIAFLVLPLRGQADINSSASIYHVDITDISKTEITYGNSYYPELDEVKFFDSFEAFQEYNLNNPQSEFPVETANDDEADNETDVNQYEGFRETTLDAEMERDEDASIVSNYTIKDVILSLNDFDNGADRVTLSLVTTWEILNHIAEEPVFEDVINYVTAMFAENDYSNEADFYALVNDVLNRLPRGKISQDKFVDILNKHDEVYAGNIDLSFTMPHQIYTAEGAGEWLEIFYLGGIKAVKEKTLRTIKSLPE